MADALVLRNHLIERFERADAAADTAKRRGYLSVVVIGGGLVGVELIGELTAFADDVLRFYPRIRRDEVRFGLFEAGPRILPEIDAKLADMAARVLNGAASTSGSRHRSDRSRPGGCGCRATPSTRGPSCWRRASCPASSRARSRSARPAWQDRRGRHDAKPQPSAGVGPGRLRGDSGPDGHPYPALAQHAVREARHLAPTSGRPSTGGYLHGSCSARWGPWRRSDTRAQSRAYAACDDGIRRLVVTADLLPLSDAAMGPAVAHRPRLDGRTLLPAGHHAC